METILKQVRRGRPKGTGHLNEELIARFASLMREAVKFPHAATALGIPLRTAYSWRERGRRLSAEFLDDMEVVHPTDRIYLHFLHEIEMAQAQCIAEVIMTAKRKIRSTSDALKFLEYICPEEFGPATRSRRREKPSTTFDLNREICRIVSRAEGKGDVSIPENKASTDALFNDLSNPTLSTSL